MGYYFLCKLPRSHWQKIKTGISYLCVSYIYNFLQKCRPDDLLRHAGGFVCFVSFNWNLDFLSMGIS